MKRVLYIIMILFSGLVYAGTNVQVTPDHILSFDSEDIVISKKAEQLYTNNDYISHRITYNIEYYDYNYIFRVFLRISSNVNIEDIERTLNYSDEIMYQENPMRNYDSVSGLHRQYRKSINHSEGIVIESVLASWSSTYTDDILTYSFPINGFYEFCHIEFYNIWSTFHGYENELSYDFIKNNYESDDKAIILYELIEKSIRELQFQNSDKIFGRLNDYRVRIRLDSTLQGEHIGYLNKGDYVQILDQTEEPMKIGEMESVWYKIKTNEGIIGWAFGYFIDIVSNNDQYDSK